MSRILTTQDISWFLDLNEKEQLDLNPPYQRRSVWSSRDKRFFVDTILNNYPAPPIFLHKTIDDNGRSTYHVVDGKQRLQTIIEFTENHVRIPDDFGDVNLQSKRWDDLDRNCRERIWNYVVIVEMLNDVSEAPIKNIFDRINRNSRKLTPQEMRHAKYEGWFIKLAETEAESPEWRNFGVVTPARIKRMADVQFISELLAIILKQEMQGFDQNAIDAIYAEYEDIDHDPILVEDEVSCQIESAKDKVARIIYEQPDVLNYLRIQAHFYTLWAYICLEQTRYPGDECFARSYMQFLNVVGEVLAAPADQAEAIIAGNPQATEIGRQAILGYARNVRGASTDLSPRNERYLALCLAIHGEEGVDCEGS